MNVSGIGTAKACLPYFGKKAGRFDGEEIYLGADPEARLSRGEKLFFEDEEKKKAELMVV